MPKQNNWFFNQLARGLLRKPSDFFEALRQFRSDPSDSTGTRFTGEPPSKTKRYNVPERLSVRKEYFTSDTYLRQQDRADWQQTDAQLCRFVAYLVHDARKRGIPLFVHSAFRTEAEQNALRAKGRSKASYPNAPHCQGFAADVVHSRYAWMLTDDEWLYIGKLGKDIAKRLGIDVVWGGDWSFYDPAHWEIRDWRQQVRPRIAAPPVRISAYNLFQRHKL